MHQHSEFSINTIIYYLKESNLQPEIQKETNQLFINFTMHQYEVPVFFVLHPVSHLIQMIAYLPYQLSEKTIGEMGRLLHLLNKELDMPGFGMDESEKLIFYRAVVPCLNKEIDKQLFNTYLGTTRVACDTFMHVIGLIASGNMTVDTLLKNKPKIKNG